MKFDFCYAFLLAWIISSAIFSHKRQGLSFARWISSKRLPLRTLAHDHLWHNGGKGSSAPPPSRGNSSRGARITWWSRKCTFLPNLKPRRWEEEPSHGHLPHTACLNQSKAFNTNFPKKSKTFLHRNGKKVDPRFNDKHTIVFPTSRNLGPIIFTFYVKRYQMSQKELQYIWCLRNVPLTNLSKAQAQCDGG